MKIIQISDLHINSEDEDARGVDVRENFLKLLDELKFNDFDYLVISGDLCLDKGDIPTYRWIKKQVDLLHKPYFVISGNHDDNQMMAKVFHQELVNGELFYKQEIDGQNIYFMDTSSYVWSDAQMEWLKKELEQDDNPMPIIFIHHPPLLSGVRYMDSKHPLKNIPEASSFFKQFTDKQFYIFCGHCHAENYVNEDNMHVFVTPSNYFQMKLETDHIEIDNNFTSFRTIHVHPHRLTSNVKYIA